MKRVSRFYRFNDTDYFYVEAHEKTKQFRFIFELNFTKIVSTVPFDFIAQAYVDNSKDYEVHKTKRAQVVHMVKTMLDYDISVADIQNVYNRMCEKVEPPVSELER